MAQGWQFIHAYLLSEGGRRKWVNANVGEAPADVKNWRDKILNQPVEDE